MSEPAKTSSSGRWALHRAALEGLVRHFAVTGDGAAEYEGVRRRLVAFFDWRGAADAEAAADETLDRVARRLEEGVPVGNLRGYAFGVARLVLLESERRERRQRTAHRAWSLNRPGPAEEGDGEHLRCLSVCLEALSEDDRALIVGYHAGDGAETREALAGRMGLSYANLRTRAHRIRNLLSRCIAGCLADATPKGGSVR